MKNINYVVRFNYWNQAKDRPDFCFLEGLVTRDHGRQSHYDTCKEAEQAIEEDKAAFFKIINDDEHRELAKKEQWYATYDIYILSHVKEVIT